MRASRKALVETLREAYEHLVEHNREYHHITPKELLDKIHELLSSEINTPKKRKQP